MELQEVEGRRQREGKVLAQHRLVRCSDSGFGSVFVLETMMMLLVSLRNRTWGPQPGPW